MGLCTLVYCLGEEALTTSTGTRCIGPNPSVWQANGECDITLPPLCKVSLPPPPSHPPPPCLYLLCLQIENKDNARRAEVELKNMNVMFPRSVDIM